MVLSCLGGGQLRRRHPFPAGRAFSPGSGRGNYNAGRLSLISYVFADSGSGPAGEHNLLDFINFAESDARGALAPGTTAGKMRAWKRWETFCERMELDPMLGEYLHKDRLRIGVAFVASTRRGRLRGSPDAPLKADYVRKSVEHVGEALVLRGTGDERGHPFQG